MQLKVIGHENRKDPDNALFKFQDFTNASCSADDSSLKDKEVN